jgi:tetratricopeptide (TPR) repeat protein
LNAPYHFENFAGGHEWATTEVIEHALAWFTIQSMKSGNAARDEKFLSEQFQTRTQEAEAFLTAQRWVDAYSAFRSIVRDFDGLSDVKSAKGRIEELKKNEQLKKEQKSDEESFRRQLVEAGTIRSLWMKKAEPDQVQIPRFEATQRLSDLRKRKESPTDSRDRRQARRILSGMMVESIETAQPAIQAKNYEVALENYLLAREVDPKNAGVAFEVAKIYALKRQKKQSIESLEESVKLGFKDVERLRSEPAFAGFADDARYQKLLSTLGGP